MTKMLKPEDLPPPEALIDLGQHGCLALMFHYADENAKASNIAHENGFDIAYMDLENDATAEALLDRYADGENVLSEWHPPTPAGWFLGGKIDGEDGPFAIFLRRHEELVEAGLAPTVSDVGSA